MPRLAKSSRISSPVITLISEEPIGIGIVKLHQRLIAFDLMRLAAGHFVVSGVVGAGVATTLLPASSAGATFKARRIIGRFHAVTLIYRRTGNLRAVQPLLGHTKIESTVRYLGIEVDDALAIAEQVDV
jgi:hypothetical protein